MIEKNMQAERLARCKGQGCRLVIDIHFWARVGTVNDKLLRGGLVAAGALGALVLLGVNLLSDALVEQEFLLGQLGVPAIAELYAWALIGGAAVGRGTLESILLYGGLALIALALFSLFSLLLISFCHSHDMGDTFFLIFFSSLFPLLLKQLLMLPQHNTLSQEQVCNA